MVSEVCNSTDKLERLAQEISKHTYARCLPHITDCQDWAEMDEADRVIYRTAAQAVLALELIDGRS